MSLGALWATTAGKIGILAVGGLVAAGGIYGITRAIDNSSGPVINAISRADSARTSSDFKSEIDAVQEAIAYIDQHGANDEEVTQASANRDQLVARQHEAAFNYVNQKLSEAGRLTAAAQKNALREALARLTEMSARFPEAAKLKTISRDDINSRITAAERDTEQRARQHLNTATQEANTANREGQWRHVAPYREAVTAARSQTGALDDQNPNRATINSEISDLTSRVEQHPDFAVFRGNARHADQYNRFKGATDTAQAAFTNSQAAVDRAQANLHSAIREYIWLEQGNSPWSNDPYWRWSRRQAVFDAAQAARTATSNAQSAASQYVSAAQAFASFDTDGAARLTAATNETSRAREALSRFDSFYNPLSNWYNRYDRYGRDGYSHDIYGDSIDSLVRDVLNPYDQWNSYRGYGNRYNFDGIDWLQRGNSGYYRDANRWDSYQQSLRTREVGDVPVGGRDGVVNVGPGANEPGRGPGGAPGAGPNRGPGGAPGANPGGAPGAGPGGNPGRGPGGAPGIGGDDIRNTDTRRGPGGAPGAGPGAGPTSPGRGPGAGPSSRGPGGAPGAGPGANPGAGPGGQRRTTGPGGAP